MRYSTKLIGTAIILATATACGSQQPMATAPAAGGDSAAPSGSVSTSPGSPTPTPGPGKPQFQVPPGSDPVPAGKLDAAALPKQFPREVYTANGGTILVVRAEEGGCQHALGEAVEQTPQHVVVNLSETKAETGKMCTMDLRHPVISVALAAPLGERTVVLKKSPPR
ncbi:hypothetical protein [Amycolatopsis jiangsuensis]|uniref:Secreted protein n=1 Tax=Amycolatopsis jiangsuensis TaxID=1181879 RepID=A0A840IUJ3_9PSEU|nr:hypothetical protein [Amycolatopsis jiangsuensis]MBB4684828.1 hypothetical protein [Amycolatopsis jiangsuensis]